MKILVTGAAGFIGHAVIIKLLNEGEDILGIDNLNSYYDKKLKLDRIKLIDKKIYKKNRYWKFRKCDLTDKKHLEKIFEDFRPNVVLNLAAQAGVRFSIKNPSEYIQSNIVGFSNLLDICIKFNIQNFIFASSSSVYGSYKKEPFNEDSPVGHPLSLYAATKRSNELVAHSYSNIHNLPTTGLRFFTVYGPWGRPDMAPFIFTKSILEEKPLRIFNFGKMKRDFTYIDDITEAIKLCCYKKALRNQNFDYESPTNASSFAPFRIFNIGNSKPIKLMEFVESIEKALGKKAIKEFEPLQPGDAISTYANVRRLERWIDYKPKVSLDHGVKLFVNWFKDYYDY